MTLFPDASERRTKRKACGTTITWSVQLTCHGTFRSQSITLREALIEEV